MAATRRNILTILGLASLGSAAIASDDIVQTDMDGGGGPGYRLAKYNPERMATALENLAKEIRATDVHIARFHIGSEAVDDDWLKQTLTIDVEVQHKDKHVA